MGKIINIANQKGGVGKTTSVVNIGIGLSLWEKTVLIVDFDPQGNTSTGFGINNIEHQNTIYDVLSNTVDVSHAIIEKNKYLHILSADENLSGLTLELANNNNRLNYLKNTLDKIKDNYDFILIDSPPSLNLLTLNSIVACDDILIPVQAEFYALQGLTQLLYTLKKVENTVNKKVNIMGFLVTMYDIRTSISKEVLNELRKHFNGLVFNSVIPRNVRIAEAPSYGESVITYAPASKGAFAYKQLIKEIMERTYGKKK